MVSVHLIGMRIRALGRIRMNAFTAKARRRKEIRRCLWLLHCKPLRHGVFAVKFLLGLLLFISTIDAQSQEFDLLLKNGQVIDPANKSNSKMM